MRVRNRLPVVGVAVAALLTAGTGIASGAAWLPPVPLNNAATSEPSIGLDAAGDAFATWSTPPRSIVQATHRPAGSAGFTQLPDLANDPPSIAHPAGLNDDGAVVISNRHGDAIAAWVHETGFAADHQVQIASIASTGAVTSIVTAQTNGSVVNIAVAINSNGDAIVAWLQGSSTLQAVTRQGLNGSFTDLTTPKLIDPLAVGQPSVGIDSAGNSIVAWQTTAGQIAAKRHPAGGSWPVTGDSITPPGGHSYSVPDVAANPTGQMVVSFLDSFGQSALAVRGTVSAGWGVTPTVGTLSASPVSHGPLTTISDGGNAIVGWSTTLGTVQFSSFGLTGAFPSPAAAQTIATDTPDNFALAGNGRGDAIAGWGTFDTSVMQNVVKTVVKPNTSTAFGAPQIVSNRTVYSNNPVIGLDELGDGVVPYQLGATPNGVAAAIFDGGPPQIGTVAKPASLQAGNTAAFSAAATDAFSTVTLRWTFGDGSPPTTGTSVTHTYTRGGRFTVTLAATDAAGNSASTTFTVTVASAPPPPPPKCIVPKLKGKTVSQARTSLSRAHCRLGKVHQPKRPRHRKLRKLIVKSSSPGRGAVRANGTKVALTLVEVPKPKPKKHQK